MESKDFPKYSRPLCRLFSVSLVCLALSGCGGPVKVEEEISVSQARLLLIRDAYDEFAQKNGRPPRSEKELRQTLKTDNPDETLTSPRDGQPFVICYNVDMYNAEWVEPGSTPVVVYEQQGDGTRWVLCPPGMVYEMPAEEFSQASFPPGHKVNE